MDYEHLWRGQLFLGFLVLALLKWKRFGTPSWVRSYTTAGKYYWGLAAYLGSAGFLYLLLVAVAWRVIPRDWSVELGLVPALILLAFLLLLRFRPLYSLEARYRKRLYDLIGYPGEAYRLTELLFRSKHAAPGPIEKEVRSLLQSRGYDPDQAWLPVAVPLRELWLKAATLFQQVREWEDSKRYRRFVSDAGVDFNILRQHFDQLSFKVSRVFKTVESFGVFLSATLGALPTPPPAGAADPPGRTELPGYMKGAKTTIDDLMFELREDVAFFLRNVCLFMARGVLNNTLTSRACRQRLGELGFEVPMPCPAPMNALLKAAAVFLVVLAIPISMGDLGTKEHIPFRTLMVATIQVIALAAAIIPKSRFGFANEDIYGRPPWKFIIGAGGLALGLAVLVGLGFRMVAFGTWDAAWNDFFRSLPWLLMAFSTATVSAFLIQDSRWSSTPSLRAKRMKDALVMALSMILSTALVLALFHVILPWLPPGDMAPPLEHKYLVLATGGGIGFLIGYLVPFGFRNQGPTRPNPRPTGETS
jgi:hypothetical protein